MSDSMKDIVEKTDKLSLNQQSGQQDTNNLNDLDDVTPSRARFFSSMNYKEYVTNFNKPPARPQIQPEKGDPIADNEFSLDNDNENSEITEVRGYSQSLPMRPFESSGLGGSKSGSGSGSNSLKSTLEQKPIEEVEEDEDEIGGVVEDPIYLIDELPKTNNVVNNIIQNNEQIRNRSQSENYNKMSIFNFCQNVRSKQNSIMN